MMESFTTTIDATTEVALERALFNQIAQIGSDYIEWLDMELTLNVDNEKKQRLDLIGRLNKKKKFIICEVKFGDMFSSSNNPSEAADEVARYFYYILKNSNKLDDRHHLVENSDHLSGKHFDWNSVKEKNTELIIVANAAYWVYWIGHRKMSVPQNGEYMGKSFPVKCYSIDIPKDYFEKQKGTAKEYKPDISHSIRLDIL